MTISGNQTYDLAKLCHSIIGLYDFIIADSFELEASEELGVNLTFNIDERLQEIQQLFMKKNYYRAYLIMILLHRQFYCFYQ